MTEGTSEIASQAQGITPGEEKPQVQTTQVKVDKTFNQEELNHLIQTAKVAAYNQGQKDKLNELHTQQAAQVAAHQAMQQPQQMQGQPQQQMQQMQQAQQQPQMQQQGQQAPMHTQWNPQVPQQQMGAGGMPQPMQQQPTQGNYLTEDSARSFMAQELERQRQAAVGNQIANEFVSKLSAGKNKYPDFDEKVAPLLQEFQAGRLLPLILMGNATDNTVDVMYDLANNQHKIGSLMATHREAPALAQSEMAKLSSSIKANEAAAAQAQQSAAAPLSQLKPSTSGADNGSMSVKDYKRLLKV